MKVNFQVSLERRNQHIFDMVMTFTCPWDNPVIEMPVWTPGSYLVRDYSRHVQEMRASTNGEETDVRQLTKNQWEIDAKKGDKVTLSYGIYSYELTVRTNFLDDSKGLLIGCNSFFYLCERNGELLIPHKEFSSVIEVILPEGWREFTSMRSEGNKYVVDDFDELFDSPISFAREGLFEELDYSFSDIPCKLVIIGERGNHDINQLAEDLKLLQGQLKEMFGELPYDHYVWHLFVVGSGGGGLEHKFSNVSIAERFAFRPDEKYKKSVLRLESHEHFHVFNVKRIRPRPLGPFDYSKEVYTTGLWIAEGLTNLYESLIMVRAGLIDLQTYLKWKADDINRYYSTPGRRLHSVTDSSFNAWIKLYKSDENTVNSSVSYYLLGGLIGLLLDIHIRTESSDKFSFDDVYRHLWDEYKKNPDVGYNEDRFDEIIQDVTGVDCSEFFKKYVYGKEELPFGEYLEKIGVTLEEDEPSSKILHRVNLGSDLTVKNVLSDSLWVTAGLSPKDKIVAVNSFEVRSEDDIKKVLEGYQEGDPVRLHVFRDRKLKEIEGFFRENPKKIKLAMADDLSDEVIIRLSQMFNLEPKSLISQTTDSDQ